MPETLTIELKDAGNGGAGGSPPKPPPVPPAEPVPPPGRESREPSPRPGPGITPTPKPAKEPKAPEQITAEVFNPVIEAQQRLIALQEDTERQRREALVRREIDRMAPEVQAVPTAGEQLGGVGDLLSGLGFGALGGLAGSVGRLVDAVGKIGEGDKKNPVLSEQPSKLLPEVPPVPPPASMPAAAVPEPTPELPPMPLAEAPTRPEQPAVPPAAGEGTPPLHTPPKSGEIAGEKPQEGAGESILPANAPPPAGPEPVQPVPAAAPALEIPPPVVEVAPPPTPTVDVQPPAVPAPKVDVQVATPAAAPPPAVNVEAPPVAPAASPAPAEEKPTYDLLPETPGPAAEPEKPTYDLLPEPPPPDVLPATPPAAAPPPVPAGGASAAAGAGEGAAAAGAEGAGMAAGAGEALAGLAGGPVGLAVMAAKAVQDQVIGAMKSAVAGVGEAAQSVAKLDGSGFTDLAAGFFDKLPGLGPVFGEATRQMAAFMNALDATAKKLSGYQADLALSVAQAEVTQTLGDIRRAQQLGPELARFADARSRLGDAGQDVMAKLLALLTPFVTAVTEHLANVTEAINNNWDQGKAALGGIYDLLKIFQGDGIESTKAYLDLLDKIRGNTTPKEDEAAAPVDPLGQIMGLLNTFDFGNSAAMAPLNASASNRRPLGI